MSEHLTPLDATFLELEEVDDRAHMHIGAAHPVKLDRAQAPQIRPSTTRRARG